MLRNSTHLYGDALVRSLLDVPSWEACCQVGRGVSARVSSMARQKAAVV